MTLKLGCVRVEEPAGLRFGGRCPRGGNNRCKGPEVGTSQRACLQGAQSLSCCRGIPGAAASSPGFSFWQADLGDPKGKPSGDETVN